MSKSDRFRFSNEELPPVGQVVEVLDDILDAGLDFRRGYWNGKHFKAGDSSQEGRNETLGTSGDDGVVFPIGWRPLGSHSVPTEAARALWGKLRIPAAPPDPPIQPLAEWCHDRVITLMEAALVRIRERVLDPETVRLIAEASQIIEFSDQCTPT